ncbi:MAG: 4-hydroxybenzoate octaprenyltransferase [Mangrovicoccus sp.]
MTGTQEGPEAGTVSDAVHGNWVDRYAPSWSRPYLRLSRADRPIGTWLLFLPCLWGVLLAAIETDWLGGQGIWIILGCGAGAWLMRGAGCTWNDITDRDIDAKVARTRSRPIPSGQVTARQAAIWMCAQALIAFGILLTFNMAAIGLGIASLALVCIYPFAKRFTWWPQVFLGLAFNWGALLAWTAHTGSLGLPAVFLYLAGIFWTIFYDTIYAHQDREDDALIGVKSTARLFAENTQTWLKGFHVASLICLAVAVGLVFAQEPRSPAAVVAAMAGVLAMGIHMVWQMRKLDIENPEICMHLFRANRDTGLLFSAGLAAALAF